MIHARTAIRQAIVAAIAAGGTAAESRVYDTPSDTRTAWPAVVVDDGGESQTPATFPGGADRLIDRRCYVDITAELQQTTGYAAAQDSLLADVEAIIAAASLPGVKSIFPIAYRPDMSSNGERPIVVGLQRFEAHYITTQGNPAETY